MRTKRKIPLAEHYDKLKKEERIDLIFRAVERNDRGEVERLMDSGGMEFKIVVDYGENHWERVLSQMKEMTDSEIQAELDKLEAERERLNRGRDGDFI